MRRLRVAWWLTVYSRRQSFDSLRCGEHLAGVVPDPGEFDQSPVEWPTARPRQRFCCIEYVDSALVARRPLGERLGIIVPRVVAGIALAEIDRHRLLQIAPQRGLAVCARISLSEAVGRVDLQTRKHVASRVGDHDASRVGRHKGGKPIEKLAAGGMAEEGIGDGAIFLSAYPSDKIQHHPAGPVARVLHRRVLDDASALIPPRWERMLVEDRRDDEEAKPVRDWARIVAIVAGVPRDAVKDHEQ